MDLRKIIHERIDEIQGKIIEAKCEKTEEEIYYLLNRKRTTITYEITYEEVLEVE